MENHRGHHHPLHRLAVAYALYAPEVFKAETLLATAQEEKSGASSALSQFGGLPPWRGFPFPAIPMSNRWLPL